MGLRNLYEEMASAGTLEIRQGINLAPKLENIK